MALKIRAIKAQDQGCGRIRREDLFASQNEQNLVEELSCRHQSNADAGVGAKGAAMHVGGLAAPLQKWAAVFTKARVRLESCQLAYGMPVKQG